MCRILMIVGPEDTPDSERKTQSAAVPTSGGLAIAAAMILPLVLHFIFGEGYKVSGPTGAPYISNGDLFLQKGGGYFVILAFTALGLGVLDDRFTLPAKPKLFALAGLTVFAASFGANIEGIFFPIADSYMLIAPWIGIGGAALWLFVLMNAANFMDGSNGLAMGTLAIMIASISFYLFELHAFHHAPYNEDWVFAHLLNIIGGITVFAILGFLFWNLQGKLYAGDAGSLFGGAVFASLGIYAAQDGNIWFPATLALPFLVDVFMTLLWRARAGHNLLTPHRHHAYQLFIRSGWGHIKTALLWWVMATICAVSALWAASDSKAMSAWVFLALLGAGCILWFWQRRIYGSRASTD